MTVPEESRFRARTPDDADGQPAKPHHDDDPRRSGSSEGRSMREALREAGIEPQDFEDR
jgi:hypothetical protein